MWRKLIEAWKADNLLEQAWNESFDMLEIDREMFLDTTHVLRQTDAAVADDIHEKDIKVNKYERDVRRKVITHCAVQGASAIPFGMVLVTIVIDIERIGDYCKNILNLAEAHPRRLDGADHESMLCEIEEEIRLRFDQTVQVLREQDAEKARELMITFKAEVSGICDTIVKDAVQGKVTSLWPGDAVAIALYARYLKRIGSHLNNLVTSVANPFERIGFQGKYPGEKSKKQDEEADM